MIIHSLTEIRSNPLFYKLENYIANASVYLKLEGLNVTGSIKLKPAQWMINVLERNHRLVPGISTALCSSSGNLGIALSIICKQKNYPFICVSDLNISPLSEKLITLYGGKLIKVDQRDENGGFLTTRLRLIEEMLKQNKQYVFVDQYANEENMNAHYLTTAYEILSEIHSLDYLFIGAGTTGTLMGCARFFKSFSPHTQVIAVDAYGSITFGGSPAKRYIPGLGTSFKPPIADSCFVDDIVMVKEEDTIKMCHFLLRKHGLLVGGSTGTVLQGIQQIKNKIRNQSTVVAISPDFGDRYLDTIYNRQWLMEKFPQLQIEFAT